MRNWSFSQRGEKTNTRKYVRSGYLSDPVVPEPHHVLEPVSYPGLI